MTKNAEQTLYIYMRFEVHISLYRKGERNFHFISRAQVILSRPRLFRELTDAMRASETHAKLIKAHFNRDTYPIYGRVLV